MSYESKAQITLIKATSRASVKIKDNFYTIEYGEERALPNNESINIDEERRILWDECNTEVDNQIKDIIDMFKK